MYQNPTFSLKDLYKTNKTKNEKIANHILIDLRNVFNRKEIPKNENPDKVSDIVKGTLNFNKWHKGKGLKVSTSKQMFQR